MSIESAALFCVMQILTPNHEPDWLTFFFESEDLSNDDVRPDDPNDLILGAKYVPVEQAAVLMSEAPWGVDEPVARHMRGETIGGLWIFRRDGDSPLPFLVHPLPSN